LPDGNGYSAWATSVHTFLLEVDGVQIGTFLEVSGLSVSVEPEKITEGGQNQYSHQRPSRMSWPNITLKRGVTQSNDLFDWFAKTSGDGYEGAGNVIEMLPAAITLISDAGDRLREWVVDRAFPVQWTGPTFAASSNEVATEELEIAHHGFKPQNP
jgi:phage tail-like protein